MDGHYLATGVFARRFVGHTKDVLFVAFSNDNRQIVSASRQDSDRKSAEARQGGAYQALNALKARKYRWVRMNHMIYDYKLLEEDGYSASAATTTDTTGTSTSTAAATLDANEQQF